ncbi:zinc finger, CCHC-type containing protein, partial [Tanacetum coccineum]
MTRSDGFLNRIFDSIGDNYRLTGSLILCLSALRRLRSKERAKRPMESPQSPSMAGHSCQYGRGITTTTKYNANKGKSGKSIKAINDEMDFIMGNNTLVLADLPSCCKTLGCQWIFKRKLKVDGTIENFKARLVIQGFKQKSGIDYFNTNALVARMSTIRLLTAIASIHNLIIHQMDVKTSFLNGELDEEIYMNQPQGFILPGNENKMCKLIKSLHGLN